MKDGLSNNIDRLFRDKMLDFSQNPPEEVWSMIEQDLAKSQKRILIPFYFKIAAGIIILLGMGTLTWRYISRDNTEVQLASSQTATGQEKSTDLAYNTKKQTILPSDIISNEVINTAQTAELSANKTNIYAVPAVAGSFTNAIQAAATSNTESGVQQQEIPAEAAMIAEQIDEPRESPPVELQEQAQPVINMNDYVMQQNIANLQTDEKEANDERALAWSVGGMGGPQYSYRYVDVKEPDIDINNQNKNQYEDPIFAYAGGLEVEMETSRRFSIQSGVYYSKIGSKREAPIPTNENPDISVTYFPNFENIDYTGSPENKYYNAPTNMENPRIESGTYSVERYLEFIEVPFIFSYRILDRKLNFDVSSGLWANILISDKAYSQINNSLSNESPINNTRDFNCSASVGLGLDYPIMNRIKVRLSPTFKYYITPIVYSDVDVYPYAFSLMTGISYTF